MHKKGENRSWKKYFLEFLMLFLAVFLGFMADGYREKLNEHKREKDYIQSLISDITLDRENIAYALKHTERRIEELDSLCSIASRFNPNKTSLKIELFYK